MIRLLHRALSLLRLSLPMLFVTVTGCSMLGQGDEWSSRLPSRDFFEARYEADPLNRELQSEQQYLTWVQRFYFGMRTVPGWFRMGDQVLERVPEPQRREVGNRLNALGREIAAEWAKDNAARRIDTRMVSVWRDALTEAINQEEVPEYLSRVQGDVRSLLYRDLAGEAIHFERYYQDDFEF